MAGNPNNASDVLLALLVEAGGLVIVTVVAGINDQVANLMLLFIAGIWLLWMINHTGEVTKLSTILSNIEKAG